MDAEISSVASRAVMKLRHFIILLLAPVLTFAQTVHDVAKAHQIPVADFHALLTNRELVSEAESSVLRNPANSRSNDGVHPTAAGYELLAELVTEAIRENDLDASKVICFGDSITFGAGMKGAGTSEGETYPAKLRSHLQSTR